MAMRSIVVGVFGLAVMLTAGNAAAQHAQLSPEEVRAAIDAGSKQKKSEQGLRLTDATQAWLAGTGTSGFSVRVYTPTTWIRQQAAAAAREYRKLDAATLPPEVLAPVLRVIVDPDTPRRVTAAGAVGSSSVEHVVLRDERRAIAIQPLSTAPFTDDVSNALGATMHYQGIEATFALDALRELRGPNGDLEFFITVVGQTGEEKDFKIKRKHFEQIP